MEYPRFSYDKIDSNIVLKKVNITGNVCGEFVEFTIDHIYENKGKSDVEAIYTFPIPETSVLSGFEANIGGRSIKGIIEDKKEVDKIHNSIKEDNSNFLLEEFNANDFRISMGKILAGENINIKISYIEELTYDNEQLKLTIPRIVPPINIDSKENLIKKNNYELNLNLLVESFTDMEFISNTHKIKVEEGSNYLYKITLASSKENLDKDMIIYLKEKTFYETTGMIYENSKENNSIIYLRFIPDIEPSKEKKFDNYIFMVDISSSMEGEKLLSAKNALQLCLRNLSKGDTFNIVAMGDSLQYFSDNRRVEYNEENLNNASIWIDELKCEDDAVIFEGIKYALKNEALGEENTILLFTDDIVDDEKEILDYVDEHCVESRIFPFGIDASVNTYFINKLAQITYGKAEFINDNKRIEDTILKQFNRIRGLQITDIEIDWGLVKVERTYPRTIEYMYDGELFSIFAKVQGEVEGVVTLRGKVGNRRVQRRISLSNLELEENMNLIEKVWYKKRIQSLQNRIRFERGETYNAMKNKLIEISKHIGVLSSETSFILMEQLYDPVLGIGFKKILPVKIKYDESEVTKSASNFYYRHYFNDSQFNELELSKTLKSELLRILASYQFASGAFANSLQEDQIDKVISTIKAILAFTLGKEDISIYKNLLNKSLNFITGNFEEEKDNYDDDTICFLYLALKSALNRGIIKFENKEELEKRIKYLEEVILSKGIDIKDIENKFIRFVEKTESKDNSLSSLIDKAILKSY